VGKDQVRRGPRALHWIRVDYVLPGRRKTIRRCTNQPVPCMQCEETRLASWVCPVQATTHSAGGPETIWSTTACVGHALTAPTTVLIRCVGFNFFLFSGLRDAEPETAEQSGRHGAQPRRDGKSARIVCRGSTRRRSIRSARSAPVRGWRDPDGVPRRTLPGRMRSCSATSTIRTAGWRNSRRMSAITGCWPSSTRGRGPRTWPRCAIRIRRLRP